MLRHHAKLALAVGKLEQSGDVLLIISGSVGIQGNELAVIWWGRGLQGGVELINGILEERNGAMVQQQARPPAPRLFRSWVLDLNTQGLEPQSKVKFAELAMVINRTETTAAEQSSARQLGAAIAGSWW